MEGYQWGEDRRRMGGEGTGNKKHKWQVQTRQGEVKNSIGNVDAKELICITYGHELSEGGMLVGEQVQGGEKLRGGEKWDN